MNVWQFASESPWTAFFLAWIAVAAVAAVFKGVAWTILACRGIPPIDEE